MISRHRLSAQPFAGAKKVGEHGGGGGGVGKGIVMGGELHPVTGAQLGKAVSELAIGIETPGQREGAHASLEDEVDARSASRLLEELGVEVGVVSGEHPAVEPGGQLA